MNKSETVITDPDGDTIGVNHNWTFGTPHVTVYAEEGVRLTPDQTRQLISILQERLARIEATPVCSHCGRPATCSGTYEGIQALSCDDCCGHGCEDGYCEPLRPDK